MPICRLCLQDRELRQSHVIPEFLFRELYDNNRRMMGITGHGPRGWNYLQRGLVERLLCDECEQLIGNQYEDPYRTIWIRDCPIPNPWGEQSHVTVNADYQITKLFHLSILFRASVSSLGTFNQVDLGPHEEPIRRMLLNHDAGGLGDYPFFGYAVIHHRDSRLVEVITRPLRCAHEGQWHYQTMYGGVMWAVCVSSHQVGWFTRISMQPDGNCTFIAVPWNKVGALQDARDALIRTNDP